MTSLFFNMILLQDVLIMIVQFLILTIILYFSSRLLGLKSWISTFLSSTLFAFINSLVIFNFEINFLLKLTLFFLILKFTYNISWSRSFLLLLILWFISNIIKIVIPFLPTPI